MPTARLSAYRCPVCGRTVSAIASLVICNRPGQHPKGKPVEMVKESA